MSRYSNEVINLKFFELYEMSPDEFEGLEIPNKEEIADFLGQYRVLDLRVDDLELEMNEWNDKAQLAYMEMKKYPESSQEYQKFKIEHEKYVERYDAANAESSRVLSEALGVRKQVEELMEDI